MKRSPARISSTSSARSAFVLFRDVAKASRAADKQKLAGLASDRLKELSARVPRIKIRFAKQETDADVLIDGTRASSDEWAGEGLPIDPEQHEVDVRVVCRCLQGRVHGRWLHVAGDDRRARHLESCPDR